MDYKCIIFDCDGVLVDSETISAKIFQQMAAELGFYMDFETAVEHFAGVSMKENLNLVADNIEGDLPDSFEQQYRKRTFEAFKKDLKPIDGIHELIEKITVPFCVASSGPVEKIRLNLTATHLIDKFEGRIFSCYDIKSWKPEPDIYLHAAKTMGFAIEDCIVIEDTLPGITAARNGGFKVFAFGNKKNRSVFEELGATVFYSMSELEKLLNLKDN